ncbi:hypothetical protein N9D80_02235 [Flavobacteriales bacterium]|nr:hypothetical protein [Flavobacteriales bacterium]
MKKLIFIIILFSLYSCELELEHANPLDNLMITTGSVQEVGTFSCEVQGTITTNEFNEVDNYGHCWSLQNNPTSNDASTSFGAYKGKKLFTSNINNLAANTSYYVRAYAKVNDTILYAENISIETEWAGDVPLIQTGNAGSITSSGANILGVIVEQGQSSVIRYGHCWSKSTEPIISDNNLEVYGGSTIDTFSTSLTGLSSNTKYYYRAYAENNQGLAYGSEQFFSTTNGEATVTTGINTNIAATTVDLEGDITAIGDASVTQHGHCWSTSSSPTINDDNTTLGPASVGAFTSNISNLTQNTTYYYRAYATNSFGTVYGSALSFSTTNGKPTVVTIGSNNITAYTVDLEGNITGIGDASVTEHGHCFSSTNQNPTTSGPRTTLGAAASLGSFNSLVSSLSANTNYYYRAYATNSFGTIYGSMMSLTTLPTPPPTGPCNITGISSPPSLLTLTPSSNIYNFSDNITLTVNFSQQASVFLYENEVFIANLCSFCIFNNNERTITLPSSSQISTSNCYTIRVVLTGGNVSHSISDQFTIY